jgi:hypothetical protein
VWVGGVKRVGATLMGLGAAVGAAVGIAMLAHIGLPGAPWLVNVALAKLALVASGGLMAGGAVSLRLAKRRDQATLPREPR